MASVRVRSMDGFQQEILAGRHVILSDEPVEAGGMDTGPNPYELLLGSLGACKAMTLRMYARRKGWDLQRVEIELTHSRQHRQDCEDCEDKDVMIDHIGVRIELTGALDDAQRKRLHEIAARCPVHRTLQNTLVIEDLEG